MKKSAYAAASGTEVQRDAEFYRRPEESARGERPPSEYEALEPVLELAAQGWRLFSCAPHNRTPLLKGWPTLASSDRATIRKWAVKHPGCNWGVARSRGIELRRGAR